MNNKAILTGDGSSKHDGICDGKSFLEYTDAGVEHWHCPKCGARI